MEIINLPAMSTVTETGNTGSFAIEPLFPGYGSTLGNALRRVLLSSLEGAAIDYVEVEGVEHEFSTIENVKEDMIQILLNLKGLRFKLETETTELSLTMKGPGVLTGAAFSSNSDCSVLNTDHYIATLDKGASISMRVGVKQGRGYEPVEKKIERSKAVGVITTDSIYSPIQAVSYKVENTRVGQMTNYDKLLLDITTDGSISPAEGLKKAAAILTEQYAAIANLPTNIHEMVVAKEAVEEDVVEEVSVSLEALDPKTKIEDAGLSGRTSHALLAAGYKTLSGLKRLSEIKLQSIKGLGSKGVDEVKAVLARVE